MTRPVPVAPRRPQAGPKARPGRPAIRRILCPTDLTEASDVAFAHALLLAETFQAAVTVYHAIDLRRVARRSGRGLAMADALRRAELEARLEIEERFLGRARAVRVRIEYGIAPQQAVAAAIAAERPDLTVMSTHGRRGLAHLVLGSIAETAIEEGGRPVLCVRGRRHAPAGPYRRILVPTDLRSRSAFPIAAALAEGFRSQVVALHVVPFERASLTGMPREVPLRIPTDGEVAAFLEPELRGLPVRGRVALGPGWEVIPELAREEGCDLIVMSTHRQDSLGDALLGSRAERVVTVAHCPVVVV